jgi:hypothetical protein
VKTLCNTDGLSLYLFEDKEWVEMQDNCIRTASMVIGDRTVHDTVLFTDVTAPDGWQGGEWYFIDGVWISAIDYLFKVRVHAERDRRIYGGFEFNGVRFQSDPDSYLNISGVATSAIGYMLAGGSPTEGDWTGLGVNFSWTAEDNTEVEMSPAVMVQFGNTLLAHKHRMIKKAQALKAMLPEDRPVDVTIDELW